MSKKKTPKVRDWPQVSVRVDPDQDQKFKDKLEENGEEKSHVLRRAIRNYNKD